jgi:hypothetical protein
VRVYPVLPDLELGEQVAAVGRDVSLSGIRFRIPDLPDCDRLYLQLAPAPEAVAVLARIVRVKPHPEGGLDVAAAFLGPVGAKG